MRTLLTCVALGLIALNSTGHSAGAGSADDLIAANREAMGGDAWVSRQSLAIEYHYEGQGLTGTIQSLTDLRSGWFVDSYELGPISGADGFDGSRAWSKDMSGSVTYQEGPDQSMLTANEVFRRANVMWRVDHGGAEIHGPITRTEGAKGYDVLVITPKGGKEFELWLDPSTHLVIRQIETRGAQRTTVVMSDYRAVVGAMIPFRQVIGTGDPKYDQTITIEKVQFGDAVDVAEFAAPEVSKQDFELAGGATRTAVPFRLVNNHIYAEVMLNGNGPYEVLVDTGGINIITPTLAGKLGLETEGAVEGRGVGERSEDVSFTKIEELRVGDAVLKDQVFAVFPLESFEQIEGVAQNGIIGFEVFRRFVARIDYPAHVLTLIDPENFDPGEAGLAVPFVFDGHIPEVKGSYEGIEGVFDLDTGSRGELSLMSPFADRHSLRSRYGKTVRTVTGWGVGGAARGQVVRGGTLGIGDVEWRAPIVTLSMQTGGAFTDETKAGNIGSGLMKRFVVTFDYGNQIVYFQEPPGGGLPSDGYDRVGMWTNQGPEGFEIVAVTPQSPAEEAGLKPGDVIVAVGDRSADDIWLPDFRQMLRDGKPGSTATLTVRSNGGTREVTVTFRDLI